MDRSFREVVSSPHAHAERGISRSMSTNSRCHRSMWLLTPSRLTNVEFMSRRMDEVPLHSCGGSGTPRKWPSARMSSPAMWPTSGCWRHRVVEDDSPGSVGPLTRDDGSPPGALDRGAIGSRGPQLPPGMRKRLAVALHKAEHRAGQARAGHQDGGDRVPDRVETV